MSLADQQQRVLDLFDDTYYPDTPKFPGTLTPSRGVQAPATLRTQQLNDRQSLTYAINVTKPCCAARVRWDERPFDGQPSGEELWVQVAFSGLDSEGDYDVDVGRTGNVGNLHGLR